MAFLMKFLRYLGRGAVFLLVAGFVVWGGLVLWFTAPLSDWLRLSLALGLALLGLVGFIFFALRGKWLSLLPWALGTAAILAWWAAIEPLNNRDWMVEVSNLPRIEIEGDFVTLHNVRNFNYRSESDFDPRWEVRRLDLRQLDSLDLIAVYWMGDAIAHTIVSFGFAGEQVAISIEIRKEKGESYSTMAGFFRQYELAYVVADERDLIGLRTTYRQSAEDVYLYRVEVPKANIRNLFLEYARKINKLHERPEFYNTGTTNCTTNIVTHVQAFNAQFPLSWKTLLSGYFPEFIYERGSLDQELSYPALRARSLVNERARAADGDPNFSRLIREGLPGME
jgi:hypothetical protein